MPEAGYLANDNVLWCTVADIDGVEDQGAAVSADILQRTGAAVQAGVPLNYEPTRSRYEGVPDESIWSAGQQLTARIEVTGSLGEEGSIDVVFLASRRT